MRARKKIMVATYDSTIRVGRFFEVEHGDDMTGTNVVFVDNSTLCRSGKACSWCNKLRIRARSRVGKV